MPHLLGVLCGTFDPVHNGHLFMALEVKAALRLTELHLMPAAKPIHRPPPLASGGMRAGMLEIAIFDHPGLSVDYRELWRRGLSTVEILEEMHAEHPQRTLVLVLGVDAFRELATWHRWEELFNLAHLIVADRPQSDLEEKLTSPLQEVYWQRITTDPSILRQRSAGCIYRQTITPHNIHSTTIRALIKLGELSRVR